MTLAQTLIVHTVHVANPANHSADLVQNLAILVLAGFVGYAVISKVPNTLHTPLMSGTNAIHGIVVIGGMIVLARSIAHPSVFTGILLFVAIIFGTINVIGGFVVTDRMLEMFKSKPTPKKDVN
jgi:NAD(P) transhydrogenase subunit alpha